MVSAVQEHLRPVEGADAADEPAAVGEARDGADHPGAHARPGLPGAGEVGGGRHAGRGAVDEELDGLDGDDARDGGAQPHPIDQVGVGSGLLDDQGGRRLLRGRGCGQGGYRGQHGQGGPGGRRQGAGAGGGCASASAPVVAGGSGARSGRPGPTCIAT